ncbi:ABC transporter substrate-binding protein [Pseudothauera rhizosphaerae]|uniref:ABC transporter substrate-binding protein n=1 Tax=Pseudothauera rhizosphaerae TaxID=2565932 RepID=A0A4S4AET0_9RHOO|nr:ABC transporter substrate-binding protein [Pseudothauera rhizosphaerae]THF57680.1 ABC transporter substrate-binding protein [Pseudothauera rhizosphaerae]
MKTRLLFLFRTFLAGLLLAAGPVAAAGDCPRIVSQSPYLSVALDWLGRGHCIVGVSRYDRLFDTLPRTGGVMDPDAETIDLLGPDLLVASNWASEETLRKVLPAGARLLRVDGFTSVADAENMLRELGRASGAPDVDVRLAAFHKEWTAAAAAIRGEGRRALVLSACEGSPYSFGRGHFVGDAFVQAGFDVVETAPRLRHIRPGEEIEDLLTAVETLKPQVVFSLDRATAAQCSALLGILPVEVVHLGGENFFHPGAGVLAGYAELAQKMKR